MVPTIRFTIDFAEASAANLFGHSKRIVQRLAKWQQRSADPLQMINHACYIITRKIYIRATRRV
ncbi:hypothetical protein D2E59_23440 [Mycobacteroides abscessus]|nr:hypothetical protein D2E39_09930 [Mycobacteroides abscessus]RIR73426.1 hypothetical protein D2E65_18660 [Mycobacteroides abscessus]RIS44763.1 hypothetical protein D2E48_09270 [Mycobacteroides abscessus]RIS63505.1 hypothetical protein D2E43_04230 [Mycobacteroides abscessus]RIS65884.1 hypothetical protein D2E59_23440 [Mycobacteroides abscessus]